MRFSIRDLLLVTVIVGLSLAYWVDHWRLSKLAYYWEGKAVFLANFYIDLDADEEIVVGKPWKLNVPPPPELPAARR